MKKYFYQCEYCGEIKENNTRFGTCNKCLNVLDDKEEIFIDYKPVEVKFMWKNLDPANVMAQYNSIKTAASISYNKISDKTPHDFVDMLIKRGHWSCLEQSNIVIKVASNEFIENIGLVVSPYMKIEMKYNCISGIYDCLIFGNLRSFYESMMFWKDLYDSTHNFAGKRQCFSVMIGIYAFLADAGYHIFDPIYSSEMEELSNLGNSEEVLDTSFFNEHHRYNRMQFYMFYDRSTSAQANRHRILSTNQESQRYVNYQYGISVAPSSLNAERQEIFNEMTVDLTAASVYKYNELFNTDRVKKNSDKEDSKNGFKKEEARRILQNQMGTQVYQCGTYNDWHHFVKLRETLHAEPIARFLANKIREHIPCDLKYKKW